MIELYNVTIPHRGPYHIAMSYLSKTSLILLKIQSIFDSVWFAKAYCRLRCLKTNQNIVFPNHQIFPVIDHSNICLMKRHLMLKIKTKRDILKCCKYAKYNFIKNVNAIIFVGVKFYFILKKRNFFQIDYLFLKNWYGCFHVNLFGWVRGRRDIFNGGKNM